MIITFIFTESVIIINEKKNYTKKSDAIIVLGAGLRGDQMTPVQIIMEYKSTSTTKNFKYSKEILHKIFEATPYTVCYSTNNFHIYIELVK